MNNDAAAQAVASQSPALTDEFALIENLLVGDDLVGLSSQSDLFFAGLGDDLVFGKDGRDRPHAGDALIPFRNAPIAISDVQADSLTADNFNYTVTTTNSLLNEFVLGWDLMVDAV